MSIGWRTSWKVGVWAGERGEDDEGRGSDNEQETRLASRPCQTTHDVCG